MVESSVCAQYPPPEAFDRATELNSTTDSMLSKLIFVKSVSRTQGRVHAAPLMGHVLVPVIFWHSKGVLMSFTKRCDPEYPHASPLKAV